MTRLSRLILVRLLPVGLAIACQGETTTPTAVPPSLGGISAAITDNKVASVTIAPALQYVFIGDQFKITAQAKNSAGQVLDRIPTWLVTNPTVAGPVGAPSATMTFKGLALGNTTIKATVDAKSSKLAKAVVRTRTGAKLVVTPSEATVAAGGTVQFVAVGLTKFGETATVSVTWSGTAGTVSPTGVLTAGSTPGVFRVIATSFFGPADTSTVTITTSGPVDPVEQVILAPDAASVATGGTVQFNAYGRNTAGDSVAVPVTYTATGARSPGVCTRQGRSPARTVSSPRARTALPIRRR